MARTGLRIRLFAMDVDGTLTDGTLWVGATEEADLKAFHSHDGAGIKILAQAGVVPAIVSGRRSRATQRRAEELGIEEVHQGVADKAACLARICTRRGFGPAEAAFVGDDLSDLAAMRSAGFSAAPADAAAEVRAAADFVATRGGGRGAVREAIEHLLRAEGLWDEVLDAHGAERSPA
jgi:3-deoxy-D-manno-octulosonate 8-phosphate phosphatase (KDO 8-P phosphatase)